MRWMENGKQKKKKNRNKKTSKWFDNSVQIELTVQMSIFFVIWFWICYANIFMVCQCACFGGFEF